MPEKPKKIYYTDTLAAAKRFEEARLVVERRKRVDELMDLLPQGHLSGLNADTIDDKHFDDLVKELLKAIQQQFPKTIGGSGGRGAIGPTGPKGDKGDPGSGTLGATNPSLWYNGTSEPDNKIGVNNDYYLDTNKGGVYEKIDDVWTMIGNIKGPQGDPGGIPSTPLVGKKKITNIYWDGDTQEVVIEHES